jgi:hypothetical protein
MSVERGRLTILAGGVALAITAASRLGRVAAAESLPEVTVYKSPT